MDDEWCYQALRRRRWSKGMTCPRCACRRVTVHTRSRRTPRLRYLCLGCRRTFTDLTGTIFARSNLPLSTWFRALSLLSEGLATVDYARMLRVKWDTARRMSRCLLVAANRPGLIRDLQSDLIGEPHLRKVG